MRTNQKQNQQSSVASSSYIRTIHDLTKDQLISEFEEFYRRRNSVGSKENLQKTNDINQISLSSSYADPNFIRKQQSH